MFTKVGKMTSKGFLLAAVCAGMGVLSQSAQAITIDFSSLPGASVEFDGNTDTFHFAPTGADQMRITMSDGVGDSVGLLGRMDGSFTLGSISTIGALQIAAVSGIGTLIIDDGAGSSLTATLTWSQIATFGTAGIINVDGSMNLQSISYTGSNQDLLAIAAPERGTETVSFQFVPGRTLLELTEDGTSQSATFSGRIVAEDTTSGGGGDPVPDAGATALMFALGLLGLGYMGRQKKA